MKKDEDSITFEIKVKSKCCSEYILQKFIRHVLSKGSNGIIGPGYRSWSNTEILVSYFCSECGAEFKATEKNQLDDGIEKKMKLVKDLFKTTSSVILKSEVPPKYIFLKNKEGARPLPHHEWKILKNFFSKGAQIRIEKNDGREFMTGHEKKPYVIGGEDNPKIIWWSECFYKEVPFSKKEIKEMKDKQKNRKKSKIKSINVTDDILLKYMNNAKRLLPKKSDPLPADALKIREIYLPLCAKHFYIPEKFIKYD
jgi:hypothetical protein